LPNWKYAVSGKKTKKQKNKNKNKNKKAGDGERGIFKSVSKLHFQASLPISIN
jgi:hypothetical protein